MNMEETRRLNADIAGSISELQSATKQFELRKRLYRILLRGKGLEFDGFREYSQEDDANSIDWRSSKRANKLLVKQYKEERNLRIVFLIDVSDNMTVGSSDKLKCEYSAEVVAALANLIIRSGDLFGFIFFSNTVKKFVRPGRGRKHLSLFVDAITDARMYGGASSIDNALDFALQFVGKDVSSVILLSDFVSFSAKTQHAFSLLSHKFETLSIMVRDPIDYELPNVNGELVIEDPKTGQQVLVNPKLARGIYSKHASQQEEYFRRECQANGVDLLQLMTNEPYLASVAAFIKGRVTGGIISK